MIVNKYTKGNGGGGSGSTYSAGEYISIENDVISVTGITPSEYLTTADTHDFATEAYVDAAITSATQNFATQAYVSGATTPIQEQLDDVERVTAIALDDLRDSVDECAKSSGLTELSASTSTALAGKADKQNVTARNGYYFPAWDTQGVITGTYTQVYAKNDIINGDSYPVIAQNNNPRPNIFAPISAGTAGQPLLSNGSGAPVWGGYKFAFITQTAYDALATKDATTIYFITGD